MADLLSLKNKFQQLLLGEQVDRNVGVLSEAVIGAVAKIPYVIGPDDKAFLDQFDPVFYKSAIKARFDLLFNELVKINKIQAPEFKKKFNTYYKQELAQFKKDHHKNLDQHAKEHLAERHAYARAKEDIASDPAFQKLIPQKDLGYHDFVVSTGAGAGQTKTVKALPYIYGPNGLLKKLEGTPGRMDGHDLFNPRMDEIPLINPASGEIEMDPDTNEPMTRKVKVTDGFIFPTIEAIQDRIDDHLKHMADGLILPSNQEEEDAYSPSNRANFKPVRSSRGYLRDTKTKEFYIKDFQKRFKQDEDNNNKSASESEKTANARRRALTEFARLVNLPTTPLMYSNGNPMRGAEIIKDSRNQPVSVILASDSAVDRDGVPVNVIKLPHKKVKINGVEREVPVLLSGMPIKRMEDPAEQEYAAQNGMELGRDYYNPVTKAYEKLFRKLNPTEMRDSYQGKRGFIVSGSFDPNRNSPQAKFMPSSNPKYSRISKSILDPVNRIYRDDRYTPLTFVEFVKYSVDKWLRESCKMDGRDLCIEKLILSNFAQNLYTLAQIKIMDNLNDDDIYDRFTGRIRIEKLKKFIADELNRFLQQDLGRGTRKNRQNSLRSRKESLRCEVRAGTAGQCVFNYDIDKFVQEFIKNKLHITKLKPAKNVSDLRSEIVIEIAAMYSMLDMIHLLYEEQNKSTANARSETFRNNVMVLSPADFVRACEDEITNILNSISGKTKDAKKKEMLKKFKDLFAARDMGKLPELVKNYKDQQTARIRQPFTLRNREDLEAEVRSTPTTVVDKLQAAIDEYNKRMDRNPVFDDKDIIKGLVIDLNKDELKKFRTAISPTQVSAKAKIKSANKAADAITNAFESAKLAAKTARKKLAVKDIPFLLLKDFFDMDGYEERLKFADKTSLTKLRKTLQDCAEILKSDGNRDRIRRFNARLQRVETALEGKS